MSEHKHVVVAEWKAVDGSASGELEGYLAVFNNRDQGGDVIVPGAFTKTISDWSKAKSPLPLQAGHDPSPGATIGSFTRLSQDSYGLKVRATFAGTADAQQIRQKMIEGHLKGLSIGYRVFRARDGVKDGKPTRFLLELGLLEGSVTPIPMNQLAAASAKEQDGQDRAVALVAAAKAIFATDLPAAQQIESAVALFKAVADPEPPPEDDEESAGEDDGPATDPDAAPPEEDESTSDDEKHTAYATDFVRSLSEPRDGALDTATVIPDLAVKQREDAARAEMDELDRRLREG